MRRLRRWVSLLFVLLGVSLLLPAASLAANPVLSITQPAANAWINQSLPVFGGTTNETGLSLITVRVYAGSRAEGTVVSQVGIVPTLPNWSAGLTAALAQGRYTAQAEQVVSGGGVGFSPAVSFVIDTTAPAVSLNPIASPANVATPQLSGAAGIVEGDLKSVTVAIHQGASIAGALVVQGTAPVGGAGWSYPVPHLADGQYTAQATQLDEAGNQGLSETMTFTVDTTAPALSMSSPVASSVLSSSAPTLRGTAGAAAEDLQFVTVKLFSGTATTGTPVQQITLTPAEWSAGHIAGALPNGQYTALSEQSDLAGNLGTSQATFRVEASPPPVTLSLPGARSRAGQLTSGATPAFAGNAGAATEDGTSILVRIYTGEVGSGTPLQTLHATSTGGTWSTGPAAALPEGAYTAVAEQQDGSFFGHGGTSAPVVFDVVTSPPEVTLQTPSSGAAVTGGSVSLSGTAGQDEGDQTQVTVNLYAGGAVGATPLQSLVVPVTGGAWTAAFGNLTPGVYTVQAQQGDDFGNLGLSGPVTFTAAAAVTVPSSSTASGSSSPVAGFEWFPRQPHVGEPVSLVSTSTDLVSAITSYSWALASGAPFQAGQVTLTTSFTEAGERHVRLLISDALGHSSQVEHTIDVISAVTQLIAPFPVVRIAGTDSSHAVHLRLLSVLAPLGSEVTVFCHGTGCPGPVRRFRATAPTGKPGLALVVLKRYERTWHAGAVLQIEVAKAGQFGKYTRLEIRNGQLPKRVDECLAPKGDSPVACPY